MLLYTGAVLSAFFISTSTAQYPKRGLGANEDVPIWQFGGTWEGAPSQVNWQYNWYSTTSQKNSFCEYIPMLYKRPVLRNLLDLLCFLFLKILIYE
jgi:hypothetical protein